MKKIIIVAVVLILLFISIKVIPLGTREMMMGASLIRIEVPKLSSLDSECCSYEATFKSLRGMSSLKKDLDKIMSKYEKIYCNGETYYYDKNNNITYKQYELSSGLFFSKYKISYVRNNICD